MHINALRHWILLSIKVNSPCLTVSMAICAGLLNHIHICKCGAHIIDAVSIIDGGSYTLRHIVPYGGQRSEHTYMCIVYSSHSRYVILQFAYINIRNYQLTSMPVIDSHKSFVLRQQRLSYQSFQLISCTAHFARQCMQIRFVGIYIYIYIQHSSVDTISRIYPKRTICYRE